MSRGSSARAALAMLVLVTGPLGCGGGDEDSDRDAVRSYIERVNAVQRESADSVADANAAYAALSKGELAGDRAVVQLVTAVDGLRAIRGRLAAVDAPLPARRLRRRLLAVFDANVDLALEAEQLARYVPAARTAMAPLTRISRRLRTRLAAAASPAAQDDALARHTAALGGLQRRMRGLTPPPVLLPGHRSQLLRLEEARSLSGRLRGAIGRADAPAIARLLLRFREANAGTGAGLALQRDAVWAYARRVREVQVVIGDARREQARLQRTLG